MRKEPQLAGKYRKDAAAEQFLQNFNSILGPHNDAEYTDIAEAPPTVHVIGAPRSGTTLLTQLIAAHLEVGYINNLIAAFWNAPLYGIRLSRKLLGNTGSSGYESDFGRTSNIHQPHEFGLFWSTLLGYREMQERSSGTGGTNWQRAALVLKNVTHEFQAPVVFKSFLLGWHIHEIQQQWPTTCFVYIRRDPVDNAISLLRGREKYLGDREKWMSLKPREYSWLRELPVWDQVAGQVCFLNRGYRRRIDQAGGRNVVETTYDELCASPAGVLDRIRSVLSTNGSPVAYRCPPPDSFPLSRPSDEAPELVQPVRDAVARYSVEDQVPQDAAEHAA